MYAHAPETGTLLRSHALHPWQLWGHWLGAMTLGELAGFAAPALAGSLTTQLTGPAALAITVVTLALAGSVEGGVLAFAQWTVLRRYLPEVDRSAWIRNTAIVAALAWIGGTVAGNTLSFGLGGGQGAEPSHWFVFLGAAGMGAISGAIIGAAQWLALRHAIAGAGWWVLANALGWAGGMVVVFAGIQTIQATTPLPLMIVIGVLSGAAMGASAAAITGAGLIWLLAHSAADLAGTHLARYIDRTEVLQFTRSIPMSDTKRSHDKDTEKRNETRTPGERGTGLRDSPMMAHLLDALNSGQDVGHYGRLTFVMVARFFLSDVEMLKLLAKQPDHDERAMRALIQQVRERDYNPPKRERILEWQAHQDFAICPWPDDPAACNVYRELVFPDGIYDNIQEFHEERAEAGEQPEA